MLFGLREPPRCTEASPDMKVRVWTATAMASPANSDRETDLLRIGLPLMPCPRRQGQRGFGSAAVSICGGHALPERLGLAVKTVMAALSHRSSSTHRTGPGRHSKRQTKPARLNKGPSQRRP